MALQSTNKKLMLAGVVAAMLLTGCSKKPTATAAPISLGDTPAASSLPADDSAALPDTSAQDPYLTNDTSPYADPTATDAIASDEAPAEDTAASTAEEIEAARAAELQKAADEAAAKEQAAKDAADAAAKKAADDEAAAKKAADKKAKEEAEAAELLEKQTPVFKKAIGEGSLHSAFGLALKGKDVYVVDNARTGLLGKFAAIRVYDGVTGDFKQSIENIGWVGAKNLPTSVNAVKIDGSNVIAGDGTTTWKFSLEGELVATEAGEVELVTQVDDDHTGDTYRISGGAIVRKSGSKTVVTFGEDELDDPIALAVDADGNIYVTESAGKVVVFEAPEE